MTYRESYLVVCETSKEMMYTFRYLVEYMKQLNMKFKASLGSMSISIFYGEIYMKFCTYERMCTAVRGRRDFKIIYGRTINMALDSYKNNERNQK